MDNTTLKEIAKNLDFLVSSLSRIEAGFDESDAEAMALLLFLRENAAFFRLAHIRNRLDVELQERLSEEDFDRWADDEVFFYWRDKDVEHLHVWKPPYEKTKEELLSMLEALKTRRR